MATNVRNLTSVSWESGPDRKLAHNTYRVTVDGQPGVMLHRTVIIRRAVSTLDGEYGYILNTGGWETTTTKQRLNALLPGGMHIHSRDFQWYIATHEGEVKFTDGMFVR